MFPCSSISQHFPQTKQTSRCGLLLLENSSENNSLAHHHHHHQNPSKNQDIDQDDHEQQLCYSSPYNSQLKIPPVFQNDGLLLSHLLSQSVVPNMNIIINNSDTNDIDNGNINSNSNIIKLSSSSKVGCTSKKRKQRSTSSSSSVPPPSSGGGSAKQTIKNVTATLTKSSNRKRSTGKKDRHSKISTAQGLRDRRMRLSLQIARKFFDLQDMLGFDKASKTIEWLFTKSKTAIKELKDSYCSSANHRSLSTTTTATSLANNAADQDEDEDYENNNQIDNNYKQDDHQDYDPFLMGSGPGKGRLKNRKLHKVARESRDKARARARDRTREKKKMQQSTSSNQDIKAHDNYNIITSSTSTNQEEKPSEYLDSVTVEDEKFRTNSEDDFLVGSYNNFPGNWEMLNYLNCSKPPQSFSAAGNYMNVPAKGNYYVREEQQHSKLMFFSTSTNDSRVQQNPSSVFMAAAVQMGPNPSFEHFKFSGQH